MTEHPKADAIAENVILKIVARVSMALSVPIMAIALSWIAGISDDQETQRIAQEAQRTFQATNLIEMATVKERISSLERVTRDGGVENTQVLQRLTTVETLMRTLVDQNAETRKSFDDLNRQLLTRDRRSEVSPPN